MGTDESRILLVEDSTFFAWAVRRQLESLPGIRIEHARSLAEARALVSGGGFDLALLDAILPDSTDGAVVDLCREAGIPCIVCSGDASAEFRRRMAAGVEVLDYIVKDTASSLHDLAAATTRIIRNRGTKALVIDDSKRVRDGVRQWLHQQQFTTLAAADAEEAVAALAENPDIRLAIADCDGPEAETVALLRALRTTHSADRLAIVGLAGDGGERGLLAVKHGASDFVAKPPRRDELIFRINRALEALDRVATIQDLMERDGLTGLFNRRYLIEVGGKLFASQKRGKLSVTLALVDVDGFTAFNERYGHEAGDGLLASMSRVLRANTRETDVLCRYGGGVFGGLLVNLSPDFRLEFFERLRTSLTSVPIAAGPEMVTVSASLGICARGGDSIEDVLRLAEGALSRAKAGGCNRIEIVG